MLTRTLGIRCSLLSGLMLLALSLGGACSATGSGSTQFQNTSGSGANSGNGSGAGTSTGNGTAASGAGGNVGFGGGTFANGSSSGSTGSGNGGSCAAMPYQAQQLPLDMYIMQDQSGSMNDMVSEGGTKWQAVTKALTAFVGQPNINGISVGIQYFGLTPGGMQCGTVCVSNADCGPAACGPCFFGLCIGGASAGDSCIPGDYATPEVEIAPLPGVGAAIIASLAKHMPSTSTPTGPALQGAVDHAKTWAMSHPGHVVIAVLATDGEPNECTPADQAGIAQIAATALAGMPSIKTFTIGTFAAADIPSGPNLLNAIAAAGGTGMAFNIDTTMNVNQAFLDALNKIRGAALGCQYSIPAPMMGQPDYSKVNVQYTPGGGTPMDLLQYQDQAHCPATGGGWYYDNNNMPTQIELCPGTCSTVSADSMGKIEILLGCKTKQAT
jgi:hypothetical protein